jgi:Zn-dependent protease
VHLDRFTLIYFGALVVSVILHEIMHGVVALRFGDDTAKRAGRLTLNPIPHIDPLGSIVLPVFGALTGVPVLAWAKPVPVNPNRLRNSRRDMLFVSLAGPATNFALAAVAAVAARFLYRAHGPVLTTADLPLAIQILFLFALVNVFLGVFNFLPIPPLDGASLIERVLPREWLPTWYRFRQYGILVLLVLVFYVHIGDRLIAPFADHLARFVFG